MEATELERHLSELECEMPMGVVDRDCGQRIGGRMEGQLIYANGRTIERAYYKGKPDLVRHYGVWSERRGWFNSGGEIWTTTYQALAAAQLSVVNHQWPGKEYEVRCIEEWADEHA